MVSEQDFTVTSNVKEIEKLFLMFPKETAKVAKAALAKWGNFYLNTLLVERLTGGTSNDRLAVRSGALRRSFKKKVIGNNFDNLALIVSSGLPYAKVQEGHEDGSPWLIKAKPGKALAIPLDAAKTASGVAKYPSPTSPGVPPLVLIPVGRAVGKGRAVLFDRNEWEPMFLLVKSVEIPPRLGAAETAKKLLPYLDDYIGEGIAEFWLERRLLS